jgi:hypothetical protein
MQLLLNILENVHLVDQEGDGNIMVSVVRIGGKQNWLRKSVSSAGHWYYRS